VSLSHISLAGPDLYYIVAALCILDGSSELHSICFNWAPKRCCYTGATTAGTVLLLMVLPQLHCHFASQMMGMPSSLNVMRPSTSADTA
jgi:hypothetical protein